MDFITSVIASALGSFGVEAIKSGYTKLKELIYSRYGEKSALAEAVEQLEKNPDSAGRKAVEAEELAKVGADKDAEVCQAAEVLQELLKGVQPQLSVIQHVSGDGNIFSGTGNVEVKR